MRSHGDDLMKLSGYSEDEDDLNIIQKSYWSRVRACAYKRICKGKDGANQWAYITGKKSRYADGKRIRLSEKNEKYLSSIVEYYATEEGREELEKYDIFPIPEHTDDLVA
jgi:hypothetical protein